MDIETIIPKDEQEWLALRTKDIRGVYIITVDVQVEEKPVTQNIPEPPKN